MLLLQHPKIPQDTDCQVYVCVCMCMYQYVCVCIACLSMYDLYEKTRYISTVIMCHFLLLCNSTSG